MSMSSFILSSSNPRSTRKPIATGLRSRCPNAAATVPILNRPESRSLRGSFANEHLPLLVPILDRPESRSLHHCINNGCHINCSNPRSTRKPIATCGIYWLTGKWIWFQSSIDPKADRYGGYINYSPTTGGVPILDRPESRSLRQE